MNRKIDYYLLSSTDRVWNSATLTKMESQIYRVNPVLELIGCDSREML